ncbi:MAG: PglZ domain-containing protein, partial [Bacteroidota bacterium]
VYNFVDMLSHARTDMEMIRELASDEPAYRSLTDSWFRHSDLYTLLKKLSEEKVKVVITTDHGTIRVHNPIKVVGDKKSSVNLRYKQGRNLNYNPKEVFEITKPEKAHLPLLNVSTSYIFALNNDFMAYPNNYNYYVSYYRNTFQHGGVSLEEMMTPFIILDPK